MAKHWKDRYADNGMCDFTECRNFFFKWLLNKVMSCFIIKNKTPEFNDDFFKATVICDGYCGVTDFNDKIYAVDGNPGGEPDEYYIPTLFTVANPILGSKQVRWRPLRDQTELNGVVIFNTDVDGVWMDGCPSHGLYELINQTACMLADNIISINSNQINSRVSAFFTAESEAQAVAAEAVLKKMYAGRPYQVLRSDILEKLGVNPIAAANVSSNITELVQLHNYIIGNFFQSIGIKSNNVRKNAHVLQEEIDAQNDILQVSILEILSSWQKGFDKVNELYGTDYQVELNPVLIHEIADSFIDSQPESNSFQEPPQEEIKEDVEVNDDEEPQEDESVTAEEEVEEPNTVSEEEASAADIIEEQQEIVEKVLELITDTEEGGEDSVMQEESGEDMA